MADQQIPPVFMAFHIQVIIWVYLTLMVFYPKKVGLICEKQMISLY